MTKEEKINWTKNANNEELLEQLWFFQIDNNYGKNVENIKIVKDEILARMSR